MSVVCRSLQTQTNYEDMSPAADVQLPVQFDACGGSKPEAANNVTMPASSDPKANPVVRSSSSRQRLLQVEQDNKENR